jgi:hypothetical protein
MLAKRNRSTVGSRTRWPTRVCSKSDLAKAWGCDSAVVSRFIKSGEPKLTWDRAMALSRLLELELEELQTRIAGNIPPKTGRRAQVDVRSNGAMIALRRKAPLPSSRPQSRRPGRLCRTTRSKFTLSQEGRANMKVTYLEVPKGSGSWRLRIETGRDEGGKRLPL